MTPTGILDTRFSQATECTGWPEVAAALSAAELYWITTVRADGRPHVTPLVGVWVDIGRSDDQPVPAFVFCTGPNEQKARNLEHGSAVAITTGVNSWRAGVDIVVEEVAARVRGKRSLDALADAYRAKYGDAWSFDCDEEVFDPDGQAAIVFRVAPAKVLAFAKSPHGQTRFGF